MQQDDFDVSFTNIVFNRKYRWTLESKGLPSIFMKNVQIDYCDKTLSFEYYDVHSEHSGVLQGMLWANQLQSGAWGDEILTLTEYDGSGNATHSIEFKGLILMRHTTELDYDSNEASTRKITVGFKDFEIVVKAKWTYQEAAIKPQAKPEIQWTMSVLFDDQVVMGERSITMLNRPSIEIEEIPNGDNSWMPGPSRWNDLKLSLEKSDKDDLWRLFCLQAENNRFVVALKGYIGLNLVETFTFRECRVTNQLNLDGKTIHLVLQLKGVKYDYFTHKDSHV
jgi:hypothetical protein